jgi:hypothetical protein
MEFWNGIQDGSVHKSGSGWIQAGDPGRKLTQNLAVHAPSLSHQVRTQAVGGGGAYVIGLLSSTENILRSK